MNPARLLVEMIGGALSVGGGCEAPLLVVIQPCLTVAPRLAKNLSNWEPNGKGIVLLDEDWCVVDERAFNNFKQSEPAGQAGEVADEQIADFDFPRYVLVSASKS